MGDYSARQDELAKSLLTANLTGDEMTRIVGALSGWFQAREDALRAMLDVLANETSDLMAGYWKDKSAALVQNYLTPMSNLLSGFSNPSPGLLAWRERAVTIESTWVTLVSDPCWVNARDDMVVFGKKLAETTKTLAEKWSRLSDEDKRLEEQEAEASRRMTDALRQAVDAGTDTVKRGADNVRKILDAVDGLHLQFDKWLVDGLQDAGVPSGVADKMRTMYKDGKRMNWLFEAAGTGTSFDIPFVTKRMSKFIVKLALKAIAPPVYYAYKGIFFLNENVLTPASESYRQQLADYLGKLPAQGAVLASFSSVRQDVKTFLEDTNMEKIRIVFDHVTSELNDLPQGSDASQADTRAWANRARDIFSKHFENAARTYESFVRANSGRFIGKVDASVEDELLWTRPWIDREQALASIGMDQRLREWRQSALELTINMKSPSQQLRDAFLEFPIELAEACQAALDSEWQDNFNDQARQAEDLQKFLEASERRWAADQIKQDLARASLKEKLPS